ncbi:MAG TPA: cation:proton antiporter [Aggregatilineales bacterium]|jgi:Kef-type K+ transport system membrane component KefB/nucleotide-binding universal stress UspA family protein|nr:cation:proton antiporter [Aggregatilineales bacterium]
MDGVFTAAPHHDVLVLLVQVAVLLFTARIMGEIAQRLGQPTVVGEILAGIILGPSLLSGLIPALGEWIVPHNATQGYLLELVSLIGVMFLLLITGLETDLALIRRQARSALGIALGGLILPLILGFILGQLIPDSMLNASGDRLVFSLFIATALAISAIPVVAKVLMDLKLTRRDIGQSIIAAAMIDDTTGWIILSVVIGLAGGAAVSVGGIAQSVFTVLAFMGLSLTVGRWLISRALSFTQQNILMRDKVLSLVVLLMFIWGAIGQWLGIEALLGAFVVGIVLSQIPQLNPDVIHKLESIALGIFAPVFFAVAGLKVDIGRLFDPELLLITVIVIVFAIVSKMLGVYIGARTIGGSDHWTAIFFGAGLNARGSIGIIVANIGLSLGILNQDMFSVIVVMAVVTSLMSPSIMKWTIRHIKPQQEEIDRLRREELNQGSLIANVRRVLLPLRVREDSSPSQLIEARILDQMSSGNGSVALTLMTVCSAEDRARSAAFLDRLAAELFTSENVTKKVVVGDRIGDMILDEARRDYDLMILGASEGSRDRDVVFNPLVDFLVRMAPCPTLLVQGQRTPADWSPDRVLVPSNGSLASRRAAEVAFALSDNGDREVTILQVVEEERSDYLLDSSGALLERQKRNAQESVEKLRELGALRGVPATAEVAVGDAPEAVILQTARERGVDLIVLGTNVAVGSERLYLGPRVERILSNAPCPVIVVNA